MPANWQAMLQEMDCIALHCDHSTLTREQATAIKAAGYQLLCYTVNELARAREIMGWGVDSVCTDRLDLLPAVR